MIGTPITNDVMIQFADVLATNINIRLRELHKPYGLLSLISQEGYAAFSHILCNNSSILNTYCSNHTLGRLSVANTKRFERLDHTG